MLQYDKVFKDRILSKKMLLNNILIHNRKANTPSELGCLLKNVFSALTLKKVKVILL